MMLVFRAVKKNVEYNMNGNWSLSHPMVFHSVFVDLQEEELSVIVEWQALIPCWEGRTSKESQCATASVNELISIHVIGIGKGFLDQSCAKAQAQASVRL